MPLAILKSNISGSNVDREKGIVYGCRLAEVGVVARYKGLDGNPIEVVITPSLITGLLELWSADGRGNGHWTHDWATSDDDAIKTRVATWRNFRKDDSGNLVADAFLWPSEHREAILFAAENDPKGIMVSQVFDYTGGRDNPVAKRVRSADFVGQGASVSALLAAFPDSQPKKDMDKKELIELIKNDAELKAAILAEMPTPNASKDADLAKKMEEAAGVTDADKQEGDAQNPALMCAILRCNRAVARKLKEAKPGELSQEAETALLKKAEANLVKAIGTNSGLRDFSKGVEDKDAFEQAVTAQMSLMDKPDRGRAIQLVAQTKPAIFNAHMAATNK